VSFKTTSCPSCGSKHDGSAGPGRRTWAYNEKIRRRYAGFGFDVQACLAPLPIHLEWGHFACKEAQRNDRCRGSFASYLAYIENLSRRLQPEGGKAAAPYLSSVTRKDGKSNDANCEAIYTLWLDCDEAGIWDSLKAWCERHGVSAIFQQSSSRKADRWHVGLPLAEPIRFDGSKEAITAYKHAIKHVASVLSAAAGFDGVGGHCGFDLCTDRLVQPMFVPMLREEGDTPAELVAVEGQALDWDLLLAGTGFDLEASGKAEEKNGGRGVRGRTSRSSKFAPQTPISSEEWGPLGQALLIDGMLGRQKDLNGLHARCTHGELHSSGNPDGYAIYFPASDTLWCSSTGCKTAGIHRDRGAQVARLSSHARAVYAKRVEARFAAERRARPPANVWAFGDNSAVKEWVAKQTGLFPKVKVARAMLGALQVADWDADALRSAARGLLGDVEGDQVALDSAREFRSRRGRVAQQGRLRELLNPRQLAGLTRALGVLSGTGQAKGQRQLAAGAGARRAPARARPAQHADPAGGLLSLLRPRDR
jgi:hypothetical protein